jgi:hypothetical protein
MKRNNFVKCLKRKFGGGGGKGLPNFEDELTYNPKLSQELSNNNQADYSILVKLFQNKSMYNKKSFQPRFPKMDIEFREC